MRFRWLMIPGLTLTLTLSQISAQEPPRPRARLGVPVEVHSQTPAPVTAVRITPPEDAQLIPASSVEPVIRVQNLDSGEGWVGATKELARNPPVAPIVLPNPNPVPGANRPTEIIPLPTPTLPAPVVTSPMIPAPAIVSTPIQMPQNPYSQNPYPVGGSPLPVAQPVPQNPIYAAAPIYTSAPAITSTLVAPTRWYGSFEYLMWWTKSMSVPVLLTTGPAESDGILGRGGVPIFGGNPIGPTMRSGARLSLGRWFNETQVWGIEASAFLLGTEGDNSRTTANNLVLARPFLSANPPFGESSEVIGSPGRSIGSAVIQNDSYLFGGDINARRRLMCGCNSHLDLLIGYRYMYLREELSITETVMGDPRDPQRAGIGVVIGDSFRTRNYFNGPQVGLDYHVQRGRWSFDIRGKLALGVSSQSVVIEGSTIPITPTTPPPTQVGGLLALNGNIGSYYQNKFAVVPEVTFNIGYDLTQHTRVFVGYNFLYWSSVLRPGDQIDRVLDVNRIPNFPATTNAPVIRPAILLKDTDFWAQGINFGLQFKW